MNGWTNLDDDEALAENKNNCINPGAPALPDGKDGELGQERESKKHDIDKCRYYRQG